MNKYLFLVNVWQAGKEKQFSIELSQLIQTANKRRKSIDKEKASVQEFEEVLQELKLDLRKSISELLYLQSIASRPDLKRQEKQVTYYDKSLVYEKSLRVPDLLQQQQNTVIHEVTEIFDNYQQARLFYKKNKRKRIIVRIGWYVGGLYQQPAEQKRKYARIH